MDYKCSYAINFDSEKRITVTFTICQAITREFSAVKNFLSVWEKTPEGEVLSWDGETFPTMALAIKVMKTKLLVQYGITEDRIIFSGIEIG